MHLDQLLDPAALISKPVSVKLARSATIAILLCAVCRRTQQPSTTMSSRYTTSPRLCILALVFVHNMTVPCAGFVLRPELQTRPGCGLGRGSRFDDSGGLLASPQVRRSSLPSCAKKQDVASLNILSCVTSHDDLRPPACPLEIMYLQRP